MSRLRPLFPEHHLTPTLSPTSWRRGGESLMAYLTFSHIAPGSGTITRNCMRLMENVAGR